MRITESQLRRIVREELNEMRKGVTFRKNPETGDYEESGLDDFSGPGAETARKMREPTMFRRPKLTDPDFGKKFDDMFSNLDLDEPDEDEYEYGDDPDEFLDLSAGEIQSRIESGRVPHGLQIKRSR